MPKDTKSLGNNKAPACESRGFVLKKEGVLFDTPSFIKDKINLILFHLHATASICALVFIDGETGEHINITC